MSAKVQEVNEPKPNRNKQFLVTKKSELKQ